MDPKHLDELITVERGYWWHVAKRALVTELLRRHFPPPARLIEGGVGGGMNLLAFRDMGYRVSGFDALPESVAHCHELGLGDVRIHDLQEPWPVADGPAQVVVLLDVLEHVPDPVAVLKGAAATLDERGGIVMTVPAIPALMGPWDRMLGHYRRYTRRMLRAQARAAGLQLTWVSHWNAFTLPPALVVRTLEKLGRHGRSAEFPPVSPAINSLLIAAASAERLLIGTVGMPAGLSLVGILKRF
jgi:SAM-dependent methyltransferase